MMNKALIGTALAIFVAGCASAVMASAGMPAMTSAALTVFARLSANFLLAFSPPVGSVRPATTICL